jgi:hypothetical protein
MGTEIRDLIRQMSLANPLWGAPRIHGELLKLGIQVSQATVGRYRPCPDRGMEIKISPVASSVAQVAPKTSAIAGYGNYSRSPKINLIAVRQDLQLLMKKK